MIKAKFARAFTLIELLVVITIIAVLTSLLLPALSAAKNRAKSSQCIAKEKQLGSAFTSYLNDKNGFYPYIQPGCWWEEDGYYNCGTNELYTCTNGCGGAYCYASLGWNLVLAPYYGYSTSTFMNWSFHSFCGQGGPPCTSCSASIQNQVIAYGAQVACPANPWPIPVMCQYGYVSQPGNPSWVQPVWRMLASSYVMNGNMFPADYRTQSGSLAICTNSSLWYKRANVADISNPSGVALLGEMPWDVLVPSTPANVWTASTLPSGGGQSGMSAAQVTGAALVYQWLKPTPTTLCNGFLAAWHGGAMNVLYPDGHVSQVSYSTLSNTAAQFIANQTSSPGGIFWGDGKVNSPSAWFANQFPGYSFPN